MTKRQIAFGVINALTGERRVIYEQDKPYVTVPKIEATAPLPGDCKFLRDRKTLVVTADVPARAALLSPEHLTLDFLTATRIIERDTPLCQAPFAALTIRLLERLSALEEARGLQDERWVSLSVG